MRRGLWVFVCGPSGAGKDSAIAAAVPALAAAARVVVARRLVTRPDSAGGDDGISEAGFARSLAAGQLAWHWQAHGLRYGIDARYRAEVDAGRAVLVNGSRAHVAGLAGRDDVRVVLLTAPAPVLDQRLRQRGREGAPSIQHRLARNAQVAPLAPDLVIDNSGPLEMAGRALTAYLESLP